MPETAYYRLDLIKKTLLLLHSIRVNLDEIVRNSGQDWNNRLAQIQSVRELSNEYGVGYSTIRKWIRATTPHPITNVTPEQSIIELKRMKKIGKRNIKKALGLFSQR